MPLRRIVMNRVGDGAVDTTVWDLRVRLYPNGNGCEKIALFTPDMYDVAERDVLRKAIDEFRGEGNFTFVDIGANVGLYALFVASLKKEQVRVLAIEPQPGIVERLTFNIRANPALQIDVAAQAVSDHEGEIGLVMNRRDRGGSHIAKRAAPADAAVVRVPCQPLTSILAQFGIKAIDALKIDIEGSEDLALAPFLRDASRDLLPRVVVIEDRQSDWSTDLLSLFRQRSYSVAARTKQNMVLQVA
jgi:FkbM family methyltransferase